MRRLVPLVLASCAVGNPWTGRAQELTVDRETELALGAQAWQEALAGEARLCWDPAYVGPVQRVGSRLSGELERGLERNAPTRFDWEFAVIEAPDVAAVWCLPGGKVAVYTGIFAACLDEAGLAAVLSHAMLHAALRHGNERLAALGREALSALRPSALAPGDEAARRRAWELLGTGGAWTEAQEREADRFALLLVARAGYDPRAVPATWDRLAGTAFAAAHPARDLERWMTEALERFKKAARRVNDPLPPAGNARSLVAPTADPVAVEIRGVRRDGPGAVFAIAPSRDVWIGSVRVQAAGTALDVAARAAVPGGETRELRVECPSGRCRLAFDGRAAGRAWRADVEADVP